MELPKYFSALSMIFYRSSGRGPQKSPFLKISMKLLGKFWKATGLFFESSTSITELLLQKVPW